MDAYNEKKWFVYLGDHHEGPFSLSEIQGKLQQGQVSTQTYVWCEGMGDWQVMTEVSAFAAILNPAAAAPATTLEPMPAEPVLEPALVEPVLEPALTEVTGSLAVEPTLTGATPSLDMPALTAAATLDPQEAAAPLAVEPVQVELAPVQLTARSPLPDTGAAPILERAAPAPEEKSEKKKSRHLGLLLTVLVVAGAGGSYSLGYLDPVLRSPAVGAALKAAKDAADPLLFKAAEKVPALAKWISPLPTLEDVTPAEYEELRNVAIKSPEKDGPQLAVAISNADPLMPSFYVASNLPDGTVINLAIEGVSETLLNQLSFSSRAQAVITKKLGKTPAIKFADGKPVPRGQYQIYVTDGEQQPEPVKALLSALPTPAGAATNPVLPKGVKLLVQKSYFLGGNKDATYTARLKEFHDKLREKAVRELAEAKQFAATLEGAVGSEVASFQAAAKIKAVAIRKKKWEEHHQRWTKFSGEMSGIFMKWTPEVLEKEFFYGVVYQQTQQAFRLIEQLHTLHHAYFTTGVDPKGFEIQVAQATSAASGGIAALKAKVEQAEKIPPAPNGMPRREGL